VTNAALKQKNVHLLMAFYHLWPVWQYHIFPHCLINGTILKKKMNIAFAFIFSLQILSETFLILITLQRAIIINVGRSSQYSCQILMKLEFSRHIIEKFSNINFHKNLFSGSRVVPCGQTDGHDEANSRLLQFRELA
jgi:hypothetical protein